MLFAGKASKGQTQKVQQAVLQVKGLFIASLCTISS
jgi:hypothetical protein